MNGDGILDFVASSPNYNSLSGAVYIICGSKTKYPHTTISVRSLGASMVSGNLRRRRRKNPDD